MAKFIRVSHYRHVFANAEKKDNCYEGFRPTNCATDGNFIAANSKFIAACVEVGGAGVFMVIPVSKTGRLALDLPKVNAHYHYILDLQWSPFNDNLLASCSEDGSIRLWEFDDCGLITDKEKDDCIVLLEYHEKRCTQLAWHPIASNVMMSVSQDPRICIWNLDYGEMEVETEDLKEIVWHASWNQRGDMIVTASKDKRIRIYEARTLTQLADCTSHEGNKPMRVIFIQDDTRLLTTGFDQKSLRQFMIFQIHRNAGNAITHIDPLDQIDLDVTNNVLVPYYDQYTEMVYLIAKGDSTIRYYELDAEEPYIHYISTFDSKESQKAFAPVAKRDVDVNKNEVMKFYKMSVGKQTGIITPVRFCVPRKSELFQADLYPHCTSCEAAIEACDWFEGKDVEPLRIDMETKFKKPEKSFCAVGGGLKKSGGLKGLKAKKDPAKGTTKLEPSEAASPASSPNLSAEKHITAPTKSSSTPAKSAPASAKSAPIPSKVDQAPALKHDDHVKVDQVPVKHESLEKKTEEKKRAESSSSSHGSAPSSTLPVCAAAPTVDATVVDEFRFELERLQGVNRKLEHELKMQGEKLKDYDTLVGDIRLLCDAVKKNDQRIASLEALVQEESDEDME